ncbi:MAG: hypothetical protein LBR90_03335 [Elusimicrobiota bacterium]|jgi:hypothetical protein|nr:hypothetical protein [Elusimicrobiota bacterium]
MKKFTLLSVFIFCAFAAFAQNAPAQSPAQPAMRVFEVAPGHEVLTNFPSQYLKTPARIDVILPQGYQTGDKYQTIFLIAPERFDKAKTQRLFWQKKSPVKDAVFVAVDITGADDLAALGNFITLELLPYFEVNYKSDNYPQRRVLAAKGPMAAAVLEILVKNSGYFKKAALIFADTTPMPDLNGIAQDVQIWAAGRVGNMARLQQTLEEQGLKYGANFAYNIFAPQNDERDWTGLNFKYLLNPPSGAALGRLKVYKSADKASLTAQTEITMWAEFTAKDGYKVNYIPREVKTAPPFFSWDADNARLDIIYGAAEGRVKFSAPLYFFGKDFATNVKIVK